MEALVAELGAAFLCADLQLAPEPQQDHASYIENWLHVLKNELAYAVVALSVRAARLSSGSTESSLDALFRHNALHSAVG